MLKGRPTVPDILFESNFIFLVYLDFHTQWIETRILQEFERIDI